jgi:transcriptional regulator with GAF, ATPase, and Fis domain
VVAETLSAIVSSGREMRTQPALFVGLVADTPSSPPARYSLAAVDRVDLRRSDARTAIRSRTDGVEVLELGLSDVRMSGKHARISRVGNSWVLEDLGSKNGTWVGAQRTTRHKLEDGDTIVVGHTVLVYRTSGGEADDLEGLPATPHGFATMSPALAARFDAIATAATTGVPIEITGETGTGKELVARAVHQLSNRTGRFVTINCGALPANLVEAELFGHRKGAFTGASEDRPGLLRSADGGTLFLDEIGELPLAAQTALLRVLQEGEVLPIGADRAVRVDLRIVTATHRSLDRDVESDRFRADLRARLLGVSIELPPLRTRPEDLGHIVSALIRRLAPDRATSFAVDSASALYSHDWPLNVRELERCLAAAVATTPDRIELDHLNLRRSTPGAGTVAPTADNEPAVPEREKPMRDALVAAIARHDGNLAAVARELGKDRTQVRRWMKRWGLSRDID